MGDIKADQDIVLPLAIRLLQACVDVISSSSWLNPALAAMEMSQMVTQGMWDRDSLLLQLPHFTKELAAQCKEVGVESVFDVMEMKDTTRKELLNMTETQLMDVAKVCNRYPDIQLTYEVVGGTEVAAEDAVTLQVDLQREQAGELRSVDAPRYPTRKEEQWWLVVGDPKANSLLAIKRISLQRTSKVKLAFQAPSKLATHHLVLYFMCDSYMGCDQEYEFDLVVNRPPQKAEDSDDDAMQE